MENEDIAGTEVPYNFFLFLEFNSFNCQSGKLHIECELPISLGPLEQMNQYFTTTAKTIAENLGGVHIDGLISHAFLKEYVWTLDFDRMCYVFSKPGK